MLEDFQEVATASCPEDWLPLVVSLGSFPPAPQFASWKILEGMMRTVGLLSQVSLQGGVAAASHSSSRYSKKKVTNFPIMREFSVRPIAACWTVSLQISHMGRLLSWGMFTHGMGWWNYQESVSMDIQCKVYLVAIFQLKLLRAAKMQGCCALAIFSG